MTPVLTSTPQGLTHLLPLLSLSLFWAIISVSPALSGGLSAEMAFSQNGIQRVSLSPKGTWALAEAQSGEAEGLLVQRIGSPGVKTAISTEEALAWHRWIDDSTALAQFYGRGQPTYVVFRFSTQRGKLHIDRERTYMDGWLVDALPGVEGELLWSFRDERRTSVHRINVEDFLSYGERRDPRGRPIRPGEVVIALPGNIKAWINDRSGIPQVAVRIDEDDSARIFVRPEAGRGFREVYAFEISDSEAEIVPVAISRDGTKVIVTAYGGQNTLGVHEMDRVSGALTREIFRRPDVDVSRVWVDDETRESVAVGFEVDGVTHFHYFNEFRGQFDAHLKKLPDEFSPDSIAIRDGTPDRKLMLFFSSNATNPGEYFISDLDKDEVTQAGVAQSDINRADLTSVSSFLVNSKDGLEVEAYLTLPKSEKPVPLVVMPHGGPVGVKDRRIYDPLVQYLASWGFAVLQPNYRGSSGYGREYLESTKKQWAKAIEDDIDAAVEYAMALPEIAADRICIVGGSYGGFSALASVVRHRDRYRCAVSINGVSDIPLLYDSSDMADSKRAMNFYEEYVGDLATERDTLTGASPAYHVDRIETPIMFIYGDGDRRVDPDHSHRMMLMLDLFGKEYDSLEVKGMLHSPTPLEWVIVSRATRRKLTQYLLPGLEFESDPDIGDLGVGKISQRYDLDL